MRLLRSLGKLPATVQTGIILSILVTLVGIFAGLSGGVTERFITSILISMIFVTGLSVYTSNSGNMSFGHVTFMGVGAYLTMYLTIPSAMKQVFFTDFPPHLAWLLEVEVPFWAAVPISGGAATLLALIVSPAFARLRGLPAGIATLSLLVAFFSVVNSWDSVTRGSSTLVGIPQHTSVTNVTVFLILAIIIALLFYGSKAGLQLRAAREDHEAAVAAGVNVPLQMGKTWLLSAFITGAAGAFYAAFLTTFSSRTFFLALTFSYIVMIVVGGYLSLSGAIIGALVIGVFQEFLRRAQDGQFGFDLPTGTAELSMSIALLLVLIVAPTGITKGKDLLFKKPSFLKRGTDSESAGSHAQAREASTP